MPKNQKLGIWSFSYSLGIGAWALGFIYFMKFSVYSLKKILFQGEAESLNCKTATGEITVLDNHIPLVSKLAEGLIKIIDKNQKEHYILIKSGFLEVLSNNETRCIVEE